VAADQSRPSGIDPREAIANRHFAGLAELDVALAERCLALCDQPETVKAHTRFHWWPEAA
jgi:hypothetical protein